MNKHCIRSQNDCTGYIELFADKLERLFVKMVVTIMIIHAKVVI
jgi:hypothetical protein